MPTFPDVPRPDLTATQRAAVAAAVGSPQIQASLQQLAVRAAGPLTQVFINFQERMAASIDAQVDPVFGEIVEQRRQVIRDALQPPITAHVTAASLQPVLDEITARQRTWAETLTAPLRQGFATSLTEAAGRAAFAGALERIRVVSPLQMELPDLDRLDRLAELVDEGAFDEQTLAGAAADVAGDTSTSDAIDDAAEILGEVRPWMSQALRRQVIVLWVWLMWCLVLAGLAYVLPPELMTPTGVAGAAAAATATWSGDRFAGRTPPEGGQGDA